MAGLLLIRPVTSVRIFATKSEALARGELETTIGKQGGAVRIHRQEGQFAEERTFPRSQDPRSRLASP